MAAPTVLDDFTIDRTAAPAPYAQIEQRLAHMIESGRLAPGDRLPSERDVAARVGVSRSTARAALAALAQRGLVERGAGRRGTCVAAPRLAYDLRDFAGFTEMARRQGLPATARVLAARELAAPPPVAEALGLRTDARAYRIERLRYVGGEALALEDTWLPAAPFRDLLAQDLSGSLYGCAPPRRWPAGPEPSG